MKYRRANVKGGTYFFTLNLLDRNQTLLVDEIDAFRENFNKVKRNHPFKLDAMVILPEHLHAIWTLPENDNDFAKRWMLIKSGFSRCISKQETISKSRMKKGERGIWQRRYWEHLIRDDNDFERHVDYIHFNPVKHGYVNRPQDWLHSTIYDYISREKIDSNWSYDSNQDMNSSFGE